MRVTSAPSTADRRPAAALFQAGAVALLVSLLVSLSGCAGVAQQRRPASACELGEASYECQVERYHNVNVD